MAMTREEKSNELTDPNSPQSKFQRGEALDPRIHYSAREGVKPEDAAKNIFEQAERDKKADEERAEQALKAKQEQREADELKISVDELRKRKEAEQKAAKPAQQAPDKLAAGVDKPQAHPLGQSKPPEPKKEEKK